MKIKLLNIALIVTSLPGYLQWGGNNSTFLWQAEADIFKKLFTDPMSVAHPFVLLPLLGQLLLLWAALKKGGSKALTMVGMGAVGVLILFILLVGALSLNYKIIVSTLPFIITNIIALRYYSRQRGSKGTVRS